jgi:hypothetical protein
MPDASRIRMVRTAAACARYPGKVVRCDEILDDWKRCPRTIELCAIDPCRHIATEIRRSAPRMPSACQLSLFKLNQPFLASKTVPPPAIRSKRLGVAIANHAGRLWIGRCAREVRACRECTAATPPVAAVTDGRQPSYNGWPDTGGWRSVETKMSLNSFVRQSVVANGRTASTCAFRLMNVNDARCHRALNSLFKASSRAACARWRVGPQLWWSERPCADRLRRQRRLPLVGGLRGLLPPYHRSRLPRWLRAPIHPIIRACV